MFPVHLIYHIYIYIGREGREHVKGYNFIYIKGGEGGGSM